MSDIFLSYAHEDRGHAERLAGALEAKGRSVWWDQRLRAGEQFRESIRKELDEAGCVVVLWSEVSAGRSYVISEARKGFERRVLVPVIIGQAEQPEEFREIQTADLTGWLGDTSDARFQKLSEDIEAIITPPYVKAYLTGLYNQTRHIEIKNLRTSDASANSFAIDELYTPLTTVLPQEERRARNMKAVPERLDESKVPLHRALEQPRLVLVGDPGAGKSTFLRRIVFEACHRLLGKDSERQVERMLPDACPFPILVRASDLARHRAASSPEWLFHYLYGVYPDLGDGYFRRRFQEGCLFLLDGLDEIPGEAARDEITDQLRQLAGRYPRARIVATSRPGVYGGVTSIGGFVSVKIAPLDDGAIAKFAEKWGHAVHPFDAPAAAELSGVLWREINAQAEIRRMAENPVMLTALACLHFTHTALPEQRSELYDSVLEWLAKARHSKTGLDHYVLLERLRKLAYAMLTAGESKRAEIERGEAVDALWEAFQEKTGEPAKRRAAERFLKEEEINSGIIVNDGDKLRFWHPTFQEYLAAVELKDDPAERQRRLFEEGKIRDPEWRETVLLLAGCLKKSGNKWVNELLDKVLGGGTGDGLLECVRRAGLAGALLKDLAAWKYSLTDALDKRYRALLQAALCIFEKETARSLPFEARLEAAEALGRAGDPRLAEGRDNWVRVEGGSFWMGAQKTDHKGRSYEPDAYDWEAPVRQVTIAPFFMGRYPVTVTEYESFVKSGGYKKEGLWNAGGFDQFSEPEGWAEQLLCPNLPVTGVSWWEAAAYCASIDAGLPSEEEWECAARCGREGVRYPWGPAAPDEHRANYYREGSPQAPTPVGMYPEGVTPAGIQDLAGNVYEWTTSWYEKDRYRTVRGGGWLSHPDGLRVSSRNWFLPGIRSVFLGFRCVRE